jgi:hypothetical protein
MKKSYLIFVLFICMLIQGCATIIKGSKQSVRISSYPSQAAITINGKPYGETPTVARLKRIDSQFIRIEMEGYKPYETMLTRKFNGWILGNILIGGLLGIIIDAATGSMYNLSPDQVNAHFKSDVGTLYKDKDGIYVGVTLQPDPSWEKIGELEKE